MASDQSFFSPRLSGWVKTAALLVTLLAAVAYGVCAIRRAPDARTRGLTLLIIWLFALPFVQSYDLILLLPAITLLLGPRLQGWEDPLVELTVWGFAVIPLFYFLGARLGYFNGFTVIPFSLLVIVWHRRMLRRPARPAPGPGGGSLAATTGVRGPTEPGFPGGGCLSLAAAAPGHYPPWRWGKTG